MSTTTPLNPLKRDKPKKMPKGKVEKKTRFMIATFEQFKVAIDTDMGVIIECKKKGLSGYNIILKSFIHSKKIH